MTDDTFTHPAARPSEESTGPGGLSRRGLLQSAATLGATAALGGAANSVTAQADSELDVTDTGITTDKPTGVDVDSEGRLWIANKEGQVQVADPETGDQTEALNVSVYSGSQDEHGLVGIACDPDFAQNGYVYLFYSPPNLPDDDAYNVVSRFEASGDQLDPNSETEIVRIPSQRVLPYHIGGGLDFGPDGVLHVALGDNTHALSNHVSYYPHEGGGGAFGGQAGVNEGDSRGTALDTSDLRGSILRIVPEDDGSYSIPDGNLFPEDEYAAEIDAGTVRPEIYAMGFRNPFKVHVDDETGWVFSASQATQADSWDASSGPPGLGPIFGFTEPGNFGWPMFSANHPYLRPTESEHVVDEYSHLAGEPYDPSAPINASPRNDGLRELPPLAEDALLAYAPQDNSWDTYFSPPADGPWEVPDDPPGYPELVDYSPILGTMVRVDETTDGGLPPEYDGNLIFGLWNTGDLYRMEIDENGDVVGLQQFLPDLGNGSFTDAVMGPDDELYLVDWGAPNFNPDDPTIFRVDSDYEGGEVDPDFELEGQIEGWSGVAPDSIAGEQNPALDLQPGVDYTIQWTNADGIGHNFAIRNADGEALLSTDLVQEEGATQTVEFTATEEMDHYVCQPHPDAMRGPIGDGDGGEGDYQTNLGDPASEITVGMTGNNDFEPHVAHVEPGATVTWAFEGGQPHDSTAYHPDNGDGEQRIPDDADAWESELLSGEGAEWSRTFETVGVYDYRCDPHESAGMVGTIVVGWPSPEGQPALEATGDDLPDNAAETFADLHALVEEELAAGPDVDLDGYEPRRPDGEDFFFDVDGDGTVGQDDVVTFFENQHREDWQRPDLFDFSGNGSVGHGDVVKLFEYVATS